MTTIELTAEQIQELREEFIEFKISQMTRDEMADWIRTVYMGELDRCVLSEIKEEIDPDPEILKDEIDAYDDNLYDVLVPYVLDEDGAYDILQEYIHDLNANEWIDD